MPIESVHCIWHAYRLWVSESSISEMRRLQSYVCRMLSIEGYALDVECRSPSAAQKAGGLKPSRYCTMHTDGCRAIMHDTLDARDVRAVVMRKRFASPKRIREWEKVRRGGYHRSGKVCSTAVWACQVYMISSGSEKTNDPLHAYFGLRRQPLGSPVRVALTQELATCRGRMDGVNCSTSLSCTHRDARGAQNIG